MIGDLPTWELVLREYGQALDIAMAVLSGRETPLVHCGVPALLAEARQRLPGLTDVGPASGVLWLEPMALNWLEELRTLRAGLREGGTVVVVASRPLARLLPERPEWIAGALGPQAGGLARLRRAMVRMGLTAEREVGLHALPAVALNQLGQWTSHAGRPDLGDRLHFAGRLRYIASGPLARFSTLALLIAGSRGSSQLHGRPARKPYFQRRRPAPVAATRTAAGSGEETGSGADVDQAVARLDAWLETLRGPDGERGYGGPVAHWWRQGLLYTGPGLDWRYEGIIAGYLALWHQTGAQHWLDKARRAGDDLVRAQSPGGNYPASAFELNPASAGTPHEAACDLSLLSLARALRTAAFEGWEIYLSAAERNLQAFYLGRLWEPEARAFRDSPELPSFVPNKTATACEALFLLAEMRGEAHWVEQYALPALERILAYQVKGGPLAGAIAQNSIGSRVVEKYLPYYISRGVPGLLRGYEWTQEARFADAALCAMRFVACWAQADGSLPVAVYPHGRVNRYPGWIAALGDVLRAGELCRPCGFDADLSAMRSRLLAGQSASGGIRTASGFAAQAGGRPRALPDLRDLLPVAGWCAMAFRYLAEGRDSASALAKARVEATEEDCTLGGQAMHLRETEATLEVSARGQVVYRWCKGMPWAESARPEFWIQ
jgi:hypothetical protein